MVGTGAKQMYKCTARKAVHIVTRGKKRQNEGCNTEHRAH